jgi:hypothetical protein
MTPFVSGGDSKLELVITDTGGRASGVKLNHGSTHGKRVSGFSLGALTERRPLVNMVVAQIRHDANYL